MNDIASKYDFSPVFLDYARVGGVLAIGTDTEGSNLAPSNYVTIAKSLAHEITKLEAVIAQAPTAIAIMRGPQFIFEKVNSKWEALLSERDYLGRPYREVYPEESYTKLYETLVEVFATGVNFEAIELKVNVEVEPGIFEDRFYDFSYIRILDGEGRPYGIYSHAFDVTERIQNRSRIESTSNALELQVQTSEQQRAKFQAALDAVADGIFIFSSEGNPVFMNDGAAKVFGSESAADVRKRVEYYFERLDIYEMDGTLVPLSNWPIAKALRGEAFRDWQIRAHRRDTGDNFIWSSSGELARQAGSDVTLGVVVLRDIKKQKAAEDDLRKAKREAENANESKTAFIANMSHEIRTPIGVIIGFCELMLDENLRTDVRADYLNRVVKNAKGLTNIIDDILDMSKIEAGRLIIEEKEFSVKSLLNDVVELFSDRASEKKILLTLNFAHGFQEAVHSDPTRLRQIFINIVGNAIKFTHKGEVKIEARSFKSDTRNSPTKYEVKVIDSGIGLPKELRNTIFQPFVQADSSTNRIFGGTGLGLAISRRLAAALGGNVEVLDHAGEKGCTFCVTFYDGVKDRDTLRSPALPSQDLPTMATMGSGVELKLKNLHILVADDSPDNQLLIRKMLQKYGATVEVAVDGADAIHKAKAGNFDVILMDVQMPRVNGYEATATLRQSGYVKPILALTAHAMAEERAKSEKAGCNAHLTKPIDSKVLVDSILKFYLAQ